jgi:hypothetical protein
MSAKGRLWELERNAMRYLEGEKEIGQAAGYKAYGYFAGKFLTSPTSSEVIEGVLSAYYPHGHVYWANGKPLTDPSSASAMGVNIRMSSIEARRQTVPGCFRFRLAGPAETE